MNKTVLYRITNCTPDFITLQPMQKAALFNLTWKEIFLAENLCAIDNEQLFFLGTYYSHNMRNLNLNYIYQHDPEILQIKKVFLSESRNKTFILMDVKTTKIETLSTKFLLNNLDLLKYFTSLQSFFLGMRAGIIYDKTTIQNM